MPLNAQPESEAEQCSGTGGIAAAGGWSLQQSNLGLWHSVPRSATGCHRPWPVGRMMGRPCYAFRQRGRVPVVACVRVERKAGRNLVRVTCAWRRKRFVNQKLRLIPTHRSTGSDMLYFGIGLIIWACGYASSSDSDAPSSLALTGFSPAAILQGAILSLGEQEVRRDRRSCRRAGSPTFRHQVA